MFVVTNSLNGATAVWESKSDILSSIQKGRLSSKHNFLCFFTFGRSLHFLIYATTALISDCMEFSRVAKDVAESMAAVSSALRDTLRTIFGRSLTNIRNSRGRSTEQCNMYN